MMRGVVIPRTHRLLLGTWLIVSALTIAAWALGTFDTAERKALDAQFSVRGGHPPDSRLVVVAIDDATLAAAPSFPLPRRMHAQVIDRLRAAGARIVAYDVVFAEPGPDVEQDDRLLRAIRRAGNVVLAATETDEGGRPNVLGGALADVRATAGSTNFALDEGGVIRRVTGVIEGLETFPVTVARKLGRMPPRFPSDGAPIDYAGPDRTYPTYSFEAVRTGRVPDLALRDKIVVVGATNPNLQDVHPTSTSPAMSGPEIEANAIETILDGLPIRRAGDAVELLLILALSAVAPLAASRRRARDSPWLILAAGIVGALLYAALSQLLFATAGVVVVVVAPLTGLIAALGVVLLISSLTAVHERELASERHGRELGEARAHAVEAADDARRQVERDLHDGAQQQLIALALDLGAERERLRAVAGDPVDDVLEQSAARIIAAVQDLRALARGSFPAVLIEGGLDGGLEAFVEQLPAIVHLQGQVGRRLPQPLEAVGYFVASEGVANALKHAGATRIQITVGLTDDVLSVSVSDDGSGGADPDGSGLQGLRDRVEAHGGTMTVTSTPSDGTTLALRLAVTTDTPIAP